MYANQMYTHCKNTHTICVQDIYMNHMHTKRHTHLNPAVIEEPAGETHDGRMTPVVDEQLRLVYLGYCTRQAAVQVAEAHKKRVC